MATPATQFLKLLPSATIRTAQRRGKQTELSWKAASETRSVGCWRAQIVSRAITKALPQKQRLATRVEKIIRQPVSRSVSQTKSQGRWGGWTRVPTREVARQAKGKCKGSSIPTRPRYSRAVRGRQRDNSMKVVLKEQVIEQGSRAVEKTSSDRDTVEKRQSLVKRGVSDMIIKREREGGMGWVLRRSIMVKSPNNGLSLPKRALQWCSSSQSVRKVGLLTPEIYYFNPSNSMESSSLHNVDPFLNDLYQFTCSFGYFQANKHHHQATFEVFFRKSPFQGEYTVFAGLEALRYALERFRITEEHTMFLKKQLPQLTEEYLQWLRQDFVGQCSFKAFPEGTIAFPKQPLITFSGPLGFVQILETPILNMVGFASLVATNANRMARAVHPKACIEFGLRRAQGPDGGMSASVYSYLGGFSGTSNVRIAEKEAVPCYGTMSHAFITSFGGLEEAPSFTVNEVDIRQKAVEIRKELGWKTHDGELAAFLAYAKAFPNSFRTLIDTYSTLDSGILNTIIVGRALISAGVTDIGLRLDSGDLCQLSKQVRQVWDKHVPEHRLLILASDDLHEDRLTAMEASHSEIDVYAVGTHIVTCKKQPTLGLVCKLTELNGRPRMKFSQDADKATLPGRKVLHRVWAEGREKAACDVVALEGEELARGKGVFWSVQEQPVECVVARSEVVNGKWEIGKVGSGLAECRQRVKQSIGDLPAETFLLKEPTKYPVLMTEGYLKMFKEVREANQQYSK